MSSSGDAVEVSARLAGVQPLAADGLDDALAVLFQQLIQLDDLALGVEGEPVGAPAHEQVQLLAAGEDEVQLLVIVAVVVDDGVHQAHADLGDGDLVDGVQDHLQVAGHTVEGEESDDEFGGLFIGGGAEGHDAERHDETEDQSQNFLHGETSFYCGAFIVGEGGAPPLLFL